MSFDPQTIFARFLGSLGDPEGGDVLYRLHAPEAVIRCGEGVRRAADVTPEDFRGTHRTLSARGGAALPRFAAPALVRIERGTNTAQTVAWFEMTETRDDRRVVAALGLETIDGETRIGWCTVLPREQPWSYSDGYLHSLADYPWMRIAEPAQPRALIDAGYFRHYWRSSVTLTTLPDASFGCQMSTVCCKHDFEISLPPEAQLVIDAIDWQKLRPQLAGTKLASRADGQLQLKTINETCRFLGSQGQCLVHQTLGRQPFGPCCIFPVAFAQTPDGVAVGLSPICDSTRHGAGLPLRDREDDLRERLIHSRPRQPDGFRLNPGREIPWELFRDVERALCDVLGAKDLPMRRRLYIGSRLLGAVRDNEAIEIARWLGEPAVPVSSELSRAIHDMLLKILGWDRATLQSLPKEIPPALFEKEVREPAVVARILQNTLFCKTYSYPFDLTSAHNFLIVLYLLTLLMQEAAPGPLPDVMWRELGSLGVHGLLKSVLHEGVPDGFRAVFGTAEFGQWMLSA